MLQSPTTRTSCVPLWSAALPRRRSQSSTLRDWGPTALYVAVLTTCHQDVAKSSESTCHCVRRSLTIPLYVEVNVASLSKQAHCENNKPTVTTT